MGQKVNPIGFRTGIMIGWKSRWYASKREFGDLLIEDHKIRKYVTDKYRFAGIPTIEIERTRDEVKVVLHAARPGRDHRPQGTAGRSVAGGVAEPGRPANQHQDRGNSAAGD